MSQVTVVLGVRAGDNQPDRARNACASLHALGMQNVSRTGYRVIVVEQDSKPHLADRLRSLADSYVFAFNGGPYNRGWGFNIGARMGERSGVLLLIDADLVVPPELVGCILERFAQGTRALVPFTSVLFLDQPSTEMATQALSNGLHPDIQACRGEMVERCMGGCMAIDADLYHAIGGHDERFRGWGREDREFWARLSKAAAIERLPGTLLHLDHARPDESGLSAQNNRRLFQEIVAGTADAPEEPIGNPGRYLGEARTQEQLRSCAGLLRS